MHRGCLAATTCPTAALAALNNCRAYLANPVATYIRPGYQALGLQYDAYVMADFAVGGIANTSGLSANNALLMEIIEERYVTLIGQIEQYNDIRRTKNKLGIHPITGTALPQRCLYPQSEINTNPNTPTSAAAGLFVETTANKTAY